MNKFGKIDRVNQEEAKSSAKVLEIFKIDQPMNHLFPDTKTIKNVFRMCRTSSIAQSLRSNQLLLMQVLTELK